MSKKQLTRADLKLRFYALMYGCSTPMDIISAIDFIEEQYDLDEGAKEYLASVLERSRTMKVPVGTGKLADIQIPTPDQAKEVHDKFWGNLKINFNEDWNKAMATGQILVLGCDKSNSNIQDIGKIFRNVFNSSEADSKQNVRACSESLKPKQEE